MYATFAVTSDEIVAIRPSLFRTTVPTPSIGVSFTPPVAVSVHSTARLSPPLPLTTVFFSVKFGAMSLLVSIHATDSPGSSVISPSGQSSLKDGI